MITSPNVDSFPRRGDFVKAVWNPAGPLLKWGVYYKTAQYVLNRVKCIIFLFNDFKLQIIGKDF